LYDGQSSKKNKFFMKGKEKWHLCTMEKGGGKKGWPPTGLSKGEKTTCDDAKNKGNRLEGSIFRFGMQKKQALKRVLSNEGLAQVRTRTR